MLARMVSISSPRDPPASASQSAGITGLSHRARPKAQFFPVGACRAEQASTAPGLLLLVSWKWGPMETTAKPRGWARVRAASRHRQHHGPGESSREGRGTARACRGPRSTAAWCMVLASPVFLSPRQQCKKGFPRSFACAGCRSLCGQRLGTWPN